MNRFTLAFGVCVLHIGSVVGDDKPKPVFTRVLETKLADIKVVVPPDRVKKLQTLVIVLDLTHGNIGSMQYHGDSGWLKANGYSTDLAKCVHIPRGAELLTKELFNEQPWVILHELAHAYHDQVLGFDGRESRRPMRSTKRAVVAKRSSTTTAHG